MTELTSWYQLPKNYFNQSKQHTVGKISFKLGPEIFNDKESLKSVGRSDRQRALYTHTFFF